MISNYRSAPQKGEQKTLNDCSATGKPENVKLWVDYIEITCEVSINGIFWANHVGV
jgi:hypothetical protein